MVVATQPMEIRLPTERSRGSAPPLIDGRPATRSAATRKVEDLLRWLASQPEPAPGNSDTPTGPDPEDDDAIPPRKGAAHAELRRDGGILVRVHVAGLGWMGAFVTRGQAKRLTAQLQDAMEGRLPPPPRPV